MYDSELHPRRPQLGPALRATLACLSAAAFLAACASSSQSGLGEGSSSGMTRVETSNGAYDVPVARDRVAAERTLDADPDAAWDALPRVYRSLGLVGFVVDSTTHVYGVPQPAVAPRRIAGQRISRFLACGTGITGSVADDYEVRIVLLTQIDPAQPGARVRTRFEGIAHSRGVSGANIDCGSNGKLEDMIADSLQARVGAPTHR